MSLTSLAILLLQDSPPADAGPGNNTVGTDILDDMGNGANAIGFTPPLPSENYTFWIQQTGVNPVTYQLDFNISPSAPSVALLAVGALAGPGRRRRPEGVTTS